MNGENFVQSKSKNFYAMKKSEIDTETVTTNNNISHATTPARMHSKPVVNKATQPLNLMFQQFTPPTSPTNNQSKCLNVCQNILRLSDCGTRIDIVLCCFVDLGY